MFEVIKECSPFAGCMTGDEMSITFRNTVATPQSSGWFIARTFGYSSFRGPKLEKGATYKCICAKCSGTSAPMRPPKTRPPGPLSGMLPRGWMKDLDPATVDTSMGHSQRTHPGGGDLMGPVPAPAPAGGEVKANMPAMNPMAST